MLLVEKNTQRILLAVAIIATLLAAVIAYYPGLHGDFMFDDIPNIVENSALHINSFSPYELLRAAFSSHSGVLYRPISMLSFAFNLYFFGDRPFSFKLTNLIIHLINALLILWLTRRLLINCKRRYQFDWNDTNIIWTSVVIAAAWVLHPLNLTSVLFIVQRMTSLAALFTLAAMLAYVYGRERTLAGKTGWPLVWLLTPAFGVIGLLCKEDVALLPLYLLVIEWLIFGFQNTRQTTSKNILAFYLCCLVLPGILGLIYLVSHKFWVGYAYRDFTLSERVLTEFRVVLLYIQWTFIPDIRHLALYHDDIAISTGLLTPLTTLWSLLALVALAALAWWQRHRRPLLSLGILFFCAGQAMESTILPLEIAFEHRNYLTDYGLLLAAFSLLLLPAPSGTQHVRISLRWSIAILAIPVLFSGTLMRAWEWKNPLNFAYYETRHHPASQRALYALGQAYSNLALAGYLKDPDTALQALSRAAAVSNSIMPDAAMMIVSANMNLMVNPAWEKHAVWLLQNQPLTAQDTNALNSLVNCLPRNCKVLKEPVYALLQAALLQNNNNTTRQNPDVWVIYANYLTFTEQPLEKVLWAVRQAVKISPTTPRYRIDLARGLMMEGDFRGSEEQIQALKRLNFLGHLDIELQQLDQQLAAARAESNEPRHKSL